MFRQDRLRARSFALFGRRPRGASPRIKSEPDQWKAVWGTRLRWMGVVVVLAAVSAGLYKGGLWLFDPARFPLRHVRVQGELHNLSESEVEEMVLGYLGRNFFALNIDELHSTFALNPWMDKVSVRRLWPDTVEVHIRERTAFGYWGQDEMVDVNGKRFRPAVIRQSGPWPRLAGPNGHELNLIRVWKETEALLGRVGLRLVHLRLDQRRAWSIQLANGIEINLGRENFNQRLQRFVDIYPRVLASQSDRIAIIDLRYTNGFAVRWTSPPVAEPGTGRSPKGKMTNPQQAAVLPSSAG